jgi:hypothetical protein
MVNQDQNRDQDQEKKQVGAEEQEDSKLIKMQRLRRAVGRLRNFRLSSEPPPVRKKSWLERLKQRLGLGESSDEAS